MQGEKIHASVHSSLYWKFHDLIKENNIYIVSNVKVDRNVGIMRTTPHPYVLLFQMNTRVKKAYFADVGPEFYRFNDPQMYFDTAYDRDCLGG